MKIILLIIILLGLYYYLFIYKNRYETLNREIGTYDFIPESLENRFVNTISKSNAIIDRLIDIEKEKYDKRIIDTKLSGNDEIIPKIEKVHNHKINELNKKRREVKIEWKSDSQNVHDSDITKQIEEQYNRLKEANDKEQIVVDISQLMEELSYRVNLTTLKQSNHNGRPERLYLYEVWRRSLSRKNNTAEVQKAILDALKEGEKYCVRGRVARIIGALAMLDPEFGILKSKQITRNEFLEKCGFVVNSYIAKQPESVQREYINGQVNDNTKKLANKLYGLIDDISKEYGDTSEIKSYVELAKKEL